MYDSFFKNAMDDFKILLISLSLCFFSHQSLGEEVKYTHLLEEANVLFDQKKYTEALHLFEELHQRSGLASADMLLKMAFIYEALGQYTQALYSLNLYYRYEPRYETLLKMGSLAREYRVTGYRHADIDYLLYLYHRYFFVVTFGLSFFSLLGVAYLVYSWFQRKRASFQYKISLITLLSLVFFMVTLNKPRPRAIIKQDNTYLMEAPSAGSGVVDRISQGHRVDLLGKTDIWYKIGWGDKEAYVREAQLLVIE